MAKTKPSRASAAHLAKLAGFWVARNVALISMLPSRELA
jgi:hypothetical protein